MKFVVSINEKNKVSRIFLDPSSVYNIMNHVALSRKLVSYVVRGKYCNCFRYQFEEINNVESEELVQYKSRAVKLNVYHMVYIDFFNVLKTNSQV